MNQLLAVTVWQADLVSVTVTERVCHAGDLPPSALHLPACALHQRGSQGHRNGVAALI